MFKKKNDLLIFLKENRHRIITIHYSSSGLYEAENELTPRITGIVVYVLRSEAPTSFCYNLTAEQMGIKISDIDKNYDAIELSMLLDFFELVKQHLDAIWIHWNMNTINFGFQLIEHRLKVLANKSQREIIIPVIDPKNRFNLSALIRSVYGPIKELKDDRGRMKYLMKANSSRFEVPKGYLSGIEEVEAFKQKKFMRILESTNCKTIWFGKTLEKLFKDKLRIHQRRSVKEFFFELNNSTAIRIIWLVVLIYSFVNILACWVH